METNAKQNLYIQYLQSEQQVLDAWFNLKSLYSKLAIAHDAMCQKFFEKPELKKFGHTQRYCIMKQYKPVMSDVFNVLNRGFPAGREFSEPLFFERRFCEYYTPDKMCIVNGCTYYPFNKEYFDNLQKFQVALNNYKTICENRLGLYKQMLRDDACVSKLPMLENLYRSAALLISGMTR